MQFVWYWLHNNCVYVFNKYYPISFIDSALQILRANLLGISVCRGIASTCPVKGLHHKECEEPSRLR